MDDLFKNIQGMDKESFESFLGNKPFFDVLFAYEAAFGVKDEYDEHLLNTIVDEYLSSTEETQKTFCKSLEFKEAK